MEAIENYLKEKFEIEKQNLDRKFQEDKKQLQALWEQKINLARQHFQKRFNEAKESFISSIRERAEQDFLRMLDEKKAVLRASFFNEALGILKTTDEPTQKSINLLLVSSIEKKFGNGLKGVFMACKIAENFLKVHFPFAKIESSNDFFIGFIYTDDNIEIDATEKTIIEKYLQKYEP